MNTVVNRKSHVGVDGSDITPSDSVDLVKPARAIYVGVSGDIKLITLKGTTLTFKNVAGGQIFDMGATRVFDNGTSASELIAVHD